MIKKYCYLISTFMLLSFGSLMAQDYAVQVAAYSDPVSMDRFKALPGVYMEQDHNNIYRYYLGPYVTEDFADKFKLKALNSGFTHARVVNLTQIRELCKRSCASPDGGFFNIDGGGEPVEISDLLVKNIFFDFDRSYLRDASIVQLDKLYQILTENPRYKAELHGHTDAVGSQTYNIALSKRRAHKTKNYLVKKGIDAARLDAQIYGEDRPIAKNNLGNSDSPAGRQLNRRVEIRIVDHDGQIIWNLVENIAVPSNLKIGG